jgi:Tol biopolymer transport system component
VLDDLALAPDGLLVAAVIRTTDGVANRYRSAIAIYPVEGSTPWLLTTGLARDRAPAWSPDGTRIAFLSDRSGSTQIWLIELHGEARQLTSFPHDVFAPPVWSPDGQHLATVLWQQGDPACQMGTAVPDATAGVRVVTRINYRLDGVGYVDHHYHHIWVVNSQTATAYAVTCGATDNFAPAWSPKGDALAFVSNRADERSVEFCSALWIVSSSGGVARRVTPEDGVALAPAWSPDGAYLAYSGIPAGLRYGANHRLLLACPSGDKVPRVVVDDGSFGGHVGGSLLSDIWQTG